MKLYLAADIGSTFTKLTAVDIEGKCIVGTAKSFTTIETDVREGFEQALKELRSQLGSVSFERSFSSSSAAGGLKMISVGLVPDLTAKASHLAAASAGAKVVKTFSYELSEAEQGEIAAIKPDIVLLSGGIDGGNKDVIIHNAKKLALIDQSFAVVIAGNKSAVGEIERAFQNSGKRLVFCENVMPIFNKLNIMPAKTAIQELFIENIISAKGLDKIQSIMSADIIPTPLAVFDAVELLSRGLSPTEGLGDIMLYDVGGATTDVYSMSDGTPSQPNVFLHGLTEPYAKRTVEGDLGMRYSLVSLCEAAGIENMARNTQLDCTELQGWVNTCQRSPESLPGCSEILKKIDQEAASQAIHIAAKRHCGYTETTFTPIGETKIQQGKDLTRVKYVIGTGGSIINSDNPKAILSRGSYHPTDGTVLKPLTPQYLLDHRNIFAAMGLLSQQEPSTAFSILMQEMRKL